MYESYPLFTKMTGYTFGTLPVSNTTTRLTPMNPTLTEHIIHCPGTFPVPCKVSFPITLKEGKNTHQCPNCGMWVFTTLHLPPTPPALGDTQE